MTRRLLRHDEWDRLRPVIKACFGQEYEPPAPETAPFCAVEEDENGDIKGFLFLQLTPHLEPFGSLGGVSFNGLKKVIDDALTTMPNIVYYTHTDSPIALDRAIERGWKPKGVLLEGTRETN